MDRMADQIVGQLVQKTFEDQFPVRTLWQTLADHFYPERADFTVTRNVGQELADNLVDSYPILVRRDLGNSFSAMLRDEHWFHMGIEGEPDHAGRQWLQQATAHQRKLMYHRNANFIRSTKEGDHDYATFGQTVISVQLNRRYDGLLYQCWHLRDCAWWDDENGQIGGVVRKWKPTYRQLVDMFKNSPGANVHGEIVRKVQEKPFDTIQCYHLCIPAEMWGDENYIRRGFDWVSIYYDAQHQEVIEAVPLRHQMYVIPRFQTIAGSPYAYSPATVVGLPDARCIQAMTHTLLEAAERYARPPIVATEKVVRGDVDLAPDGITWVDDQYDQRTGAALQPLNQDRGGFPIGMDMRTGVYAVLDSAFYLNKINLPRIDREMTAYEVSERMKQFRRENLPLFQPIEAEYNGGLCETTFNVMMTYGFFGSPDDIPMSLRGSDVNFKFESPLTESEEEKNITRFGQISGVLAEAAQHDPGVATNVDFDAAVRDAVRGAGAPATWLRDPDDVDQARSTQDAVAALNTGLELEQKAVAASGAA